MMDELSRWYENLNYQEAKDILREKLDNMKMNFIAAGYYMKYIRDNELFREDGYESIWEFAEDNYGIKKSTASRWISMNDKFSQGGNSPILAEEYRGFEKSQLQEMLYLDDKQIETVTPDMTVKEIREVRKPELLSAYGMKKRAYPEDSLLKTEGCEGGHDCCSCAQECAVRGEYRYCQDAPMGNPFPCDTMDSLSYLREALGNKCLFVNQDLAEHYVTGDANPCCKDCKNPCTRECWRAFQFRTEKNKKKDEAVATSQQEEEPEYMNPPEEALGYEPEVIAEEKVEVVDAGTGEELYEEASDQSDIDLLNEELDKAKNNLDLMLACYTDKDIRVRKQKLLVGALAGMISNLDTGDIPEPQQPEPFEVPFLKNNDQRKEFLNRYQVWPIWFEVPEASEVYHRLDLLDGSSIVICEYHMWLDWKEKYTDANPDSIGTREYLLRPGYHYLEDCKTNTTALVEHLKKVQKEGNRCLQE